MAASAGRRVAVVWPDDREEPGFVGTEEQNRGDPLEGVLARAVDRDSAEPYRLIDGMVVGQRLIEAAGESQRRGIGNDELHGDCGADAAVHQRRGGTREQIVGGRLARLARVEHDEPGNRSAGMEQASEPRRRHQIRLTGELVLQREHSHAAVERRRDR